MKKFYIQSISVFSLVIPLTITLIAWIVITTVKSSMLGDFEQVKSTYQNDQVLNAQLAKLKTQVGYAKYVPEWQSLMKGDSFSKLNQQLEKSINTANNSKTLTLTSQKRESKPRFGVKGNYSAYSYGLEGTYGEMQQCLLDLEARMPNTMLTKLDIEPSRSGNLYNFKLNFTTWELAK
jgi:hypothetical protein